MCTLAWGSAGDGFWICFNRDEQRSRPLAEPPQVHPGRHGPVVYARDPEGGGTWLAAASAGFAVGLLNHYPAQPAPAPPMPSSRGLLVKDLAEQAGPREAIARITGMAKERYRPFTLFILWPENLAGFDWDGAALCRTAQRRGLWTSSSYEPEAVAEWRRQHWGQCFPQRQPTFAEAARMLRQTYPRKPAYGLTMDREDARTVSQVELAAGAGRIDFAYRAREDGGPGYAPPVTVRWRAGAVGL